MISPRFKNTIVAALDVDTQSRAELLYESLKKYVGGFKVGPRLLLNSEKSFLKKISKENLLFVDFKFYDIPSTTVSAVRVMAELGADWVTVHAQVGSKCIAELIKLEKEIRQTNPDFRILFVTVLTSYSDSDLPPNWKSESVSALVNLLVETVSINGGTSIVCSGHELLVLKEKFPEIFFVVPGIRSKNDQTQDQSRVMTPASALSQGAGAIVIGRPIVEAKDPVEAALKIISEIQ